MEAKRYLTFKYPAYSEKLSESSRKTLEFQGGEMTQDEAQTFEKMPMFELYLKMREWDDRAKEVEIKNATIDFYKDLAFTHLAYTLV